jgi:hypothetical protein
MARAAPTKIVIEPDDYYAKHAGRTADGRQFFLTKPFEATDEEGGGAEFVALYLFDATGRLIEARIDNLGPRATLDEARAKAVYEQRLKDLGTVTLERIEVAPFQLERFGTTFGLVPRPPEDEDDEWSVELLPGNYMAFVPPWDGTYDT